MSKLVFTLMTVGKKLATQIYYVDRRVEIFTLFACLYEARDRLKAIEIVAGGMPFLYRAG